MTILDSLNGNVNDLRKGLTFVLKWEGGYSFDPKDPGGETNWGISKKSYPNEDIKNLSRERALEIYCNDYWLKAHCELIPFPTNVAVFDTAVNCGVSRAIKWYEESEGDCKKFFELRHDHYVNIINKNTNLVRFAKGWWARLDDLKKYVEINSKPT